MPVCPGHTAPLGLWVMVPGVEGTAVNATAVLTVLLVPQALVAETVQLPAVGDVPYVTFIWVVPCPV